MQENAIKEYEDFFDNLLNTKQFKDFDLKNNIEYDEEEKAITLFKEEFHMVFCRNRHIYSLFTVKFKDFRYNNINNFMEKLEELLIENAFPKIKNNHIIENYDKTKDIIDNNVNEKKDNRENTNYNHIILENIELKDEIKKQKNEYQTKTINAINKITEYFLKQIKEEENKKAIKRYKKKENKYKKIIDDIIFDALK